MSADDFIQASARMVEAALARDLPSTDDAPCRLHEAMRYAVLGGGKRLRAAIVRAACLACDGDDTACLPAMQAVELLHAYTLVHDDLPAMDDDDLRRGKPSCHKAYDEATAILVGDALQAEAFLRLADCGTAAIRCLARAASSRGVVGGQHDDLAAEGRANELPRSPSERRALLRGIHRRKTAALIRAACELGGICAGASGIDRDRLAAFGTGIGLAFQIVDDVLDATGESSQLGKTAGSDAAHGKLTWAGEYGVEASRAEAARLRAEALGVLTTFNNRADHLRRLADCIVDRRQ
jgi:farnesyl diphosphate synthase